MYWVYILYSVKFDKTYVGFTSNLDLRLESHNELAKKGWTRRFRPWTILHSEKFSSKEDAMSREKYFKSGVGRSLIQKMKP